MTPEAYYWIYVAYLSIAGLTSMSLGIKAYNGYKANKHRRYNLQQLIRSKPMDYILHALHVPPYLMAAYWYYDAYEHTKDEIH